MTTRPSIGPFTRFTLIGVIFGEITLPLLGMLSGQFGLTAGLVGGFIGGLVGGAVCGVGARLADTSRRKHEQIVLN